LNADEGRFILVYGTVGDPKFNNDFRMGDADSSLSPSTNGIWR